MAEEEKALAKLIEYGFLEQEDSKVEGIAKRAINHGYESLSQAQKGVLSSWLQRECDGVTDPGGHHNGCQIVLEGQALADALDCESYGDGFICDSCVQEANEHQRRWDQMNDE